MIRGPVAESEIDPQLELMTIQRERLVAALPADHPLANCLRLTVRDRTENDRLLAAARAVEPIR